MNTKTALRATRDLATFATGLYFMQQIVVYGRDVPAVATVGVLWMVGFPIANLLDVVRVRSKDADNGQDD